MVIMRQDTAQQNVLLDMHMMELLDVWLIVPRLIIMGIPYSEIKRIKNVQLTAQIQSHMVTQQQDIATVHVQQTTTNQIQQIKDVWTLVPMMQHIKPMLMMDNVWLIVLMGHGHIPQQKNVKHHALLLTPTKITPQETTFVLHHAQLPITSQMPQIYVWIHVLMEHMEMMLFPDCVLVSVWLLCGV